MIIGMWNPMFMSDIQFFKDEFQTCLGSNETAPISLGACISTWSWKEARYCFWTSVSREYNKINNKFILTPRLDSDLTFLGRRIPLRWSFLLWLWLVWFFDFAIVRELKLIDRRYTETFQAYNASSDTSHSSTWVQILNEANTIVFWSWRDKVTDK